MSNDLRATTESGRTTALTILGASRLIATIALSWALTIRLTPPNRPVENGLEVLVPGFIIIVLGFPWVSAGIALMRHGTSAVRSAVRVDILAIVLVVGASLTFWRFWCMVAAIPFAADLAVLQVIARKAR